MYLFIQWVLRMGEYRYHASVSCQHMPYFEVLGARDGCRYQPPIHDAQKIKNKIQRMSLPCHLLSQHSNRLHHHVHQKDRKVLRSHISFVIQLIEIWWIISTGGINEYCGVEYLCVIVAIWRLYRAMFTLVWSDSPENNWFCASTPSAYLRRLLARNARQMPSVFYHPHQGLLLQIPHLTPPATALTSFELVSLTFLWLGSPVFLEGGSSGYWSIGLDHYRRRSVFWYSTPTI